MKNFFIETGRNFLEVFRGRNLGWHALAIVLTWGLVVSGFDWGFFLFAVSSSWRVVFFPALFLGTLLPVLFPLTLLLWGWKTKRDALVRTGALVAQAALLGSLVSSLYKTFTGRIQPPVHGLFGGTDVAQLADTSRLFQFGFWEHGIFWGWPSSHTTIAFAMSFTLVMLFPKNVWARTLAIAYAVFVGFGTAMTSIHWFSEFFAGVIFGSLIGIIVGKSREGKKKL